MKRNGKRIFCILMLILLIVTACQTNGNEVENLGSYFMEPQYKWGDVSGKTIVICGEDNNLNRPYVEKAFERYQSLTKNKLEIVKMSNQELDSYLFMAFVEESIDPPDIIFTQGGTNLDVVNPDENLYDFTKAEWIKDLNKSALNQSIYNGRIIGLPHSEASTSGILYNKDIFKKYDLTIPTTQQEFLALCEVLKQNGITPLYLPYAEISMLLYQFPMDSFLQHGDILQNLNNGTLSYSELPEMKKIVAWYKTMSDKGYFGEHYLENNWDGMSHAMQSQEYAMMLCWDTWLYSNYEGDPAQFGLMPAFVGIPEKGCFEGPNMTLFSVVQNSENLDAAIDFITFTADPYNYNVLFEGLNSAPIHRNQIGNIATPQFVEAEKLINELYCDSTAWLRIKGFSQMDASFIQRHMQESGYTVEDCLLDMDSSRKNRMTQ